MWVTRLSLRWRVAIAFGLGSLMITGVLAVLTWNLASGYMVRQREAGAVAQSQVNVRLVEGALRSDPTGLKDLLRGLATDSGTTVLLQQPGGWLTSGRQIDPMRLPHPLLDLASHGMPAHQRLVVDGDPVLAVAWPVGTVVYVQLFPLTSLDQAFRFLSAVLTIGVLAAALLGVVLGHWASRRALRPLTELTAAASRVAAGDLAARLSERPDPDLMALARTFNATADALERRVRQDARFAADVSHELRSPLTTMANAAAVLARRRDELTGTAARALDLLLSEVARFQRMVVDLMDISRDRLVDREDDELVDLGELVCNVAAVAPTPTPAPDVSEPAPLVQGDRRRLDRVVANLVENAERYGGGPIRIAVLRREDQARIEVDDAGPGVPEEHRRQVFERFSRGGLAGSRGGDGGSGLGLALVAQHVERHGGRVWVEDRPGGGARFVVEVPEVPR